MATKAFFIQRLNDHVQYLKKIQATLDGNGDFQGTAHTECKLGRWLFGAGSDEAVLIGADAKALFDSLIEPHERFHLASRQALDSQQAGDMVSAEATLTEMHKLSTVLINKLLELDRLANLSPAPAPLAAVR
ncbi:MAG TPA: hypothetical protein ENJ65_01240 [Candidatus Tenderia electrophaga]|uniref:Chemoreceptor zinc-binding domain-containing protein n=1 Tax=Candidatus Tenderia electrophaga TaxID=1748243 RepID=A0A832J7J9_9GAMM|nr:hypothetical protein [Candidatus Tenderia electrophaga]